MFNLGFAFLFQLPLIKTYVKIEKSIIMKYLLIICSVICFQTISTAQQYFTRTGHIHVESKSKLMEMEADNYQMNSRFDPNTGEASFVGLIKSFEFDLGLADRLLHNKRINVVEQPKITFEGKITGLEDKDLTVAGRHRVKVAGNLYIWGYKRVTSADGIVTVNEDGTMRAESDFKMVIEKESVEKINELMRSYLPSVVSVDAEELGLSREINVAVNMKYRPRG